MQRQTENGGSGGYVLGLDLGVSSIGWAVLQPDGSGRPCGVIDTGVHLFEAGVGEGSYEQGREESKAGPRRAARAMRRGHWRRQRRRQKVLRALQEHGLLPEGDVSTPERVDAYVKALDRELRRRWCGTGAHREHVIYPLQIRAAAVGGALEAHEVGRAIYHLAQRRGFVSNRRTGGGEDDEEEGKVHTAIGELDERIRASGEPTLGAYLATLDPDEERIRGRWTARRMYEEEFSAIWAAQSAHHASMTDEAREEIQEAIFHQRPLRKQSHLIGRCSLIPKKRRAPAAHRQYQRFRLLQKLNDLEIIEPGKPKRKPSEEERERILSLLEREGAVRFTTLRQKKRGLGLAKGTTFNFESEGETSLVGHRTDAKLREVFGDRLDALGEEEKDQVVEDLRSIREPEALRKRGRVHWGLSEEAAVRLSELRLEEGYGRLSLAATRRLLPRLERGEALESARKEEFPESFEAVEPVDELPPLSPSARKRIADPAARAAVERFGEIRNPAVERALTELRRVVNAIVRRHGKPGVVRIELGRDLKRGRKERERISKRNAQQRTAREAAKGRIIEEVKIADPKPTDIEKVLLADECGWRCPFTGRCFGMRELLGPEPQFDVEHIWPYSRSLDNGFINKTICAIDENRNRKRNRTPREAYAGTPGAYEAILERVRAFKGDARTRAEKLARFEAAGIPEEFLTRHLNDTRYMSRRAAEYVALLYGGLSDDAHTRRVRTTTGGLTSVLRRGWGLNRILGSIDAKNRADHRHHAIDAVVVGLTDVGTVQRASRAAQEAERRGSGRLFESFELPWEGFREEVERVVGGIVVSHRQSRGLSGKLHEETLYSAPIGGRDARTTGDARPTADGAGGRDARPTGDARPTADGAGGRDARTTGDARPTADGAGGRDARPTVHHVRKELWKLTAKEVGQIVDGRTRALVRAKLEELGEADPKKAFAPPEHLPTHTDGSGRVRRLRKARVQTGKKPVAIGSGANRRYVKPGANHHTVIVAHLDAQGREVKWTDHPVTLLEAYRRKAAGEPVVQREWGPRKAAGEPVVQREWGPRKAGGTPAPLKAFKFSLMVNEFIEMDTDGGRGAASVGQAGGRGAASVGQAGGRDARPTRRVYRVLSVSAGDIEVCEHTDGRSSAERRAAGDRDRVQGASLFRRNARKVSVTYLGEVRRAGG